jgi:hypothetical protein
MKKFLSLLLAASMMLAASYATAETAAPTEKKAKQADVKKKAAKKKPAKKAAAKEPEEEEPDVTGAAVSEYDCDRGHKITVYRNEANAQSAAMRWNKKLYRMNRVETESGAERLEHQRLGLVFIGIPVKAMLLDAKKGRQLANECTTIEQRTAAEKEKNQQAGTVQPVKEESQQTGATPAVKEEKN